MTSKFFASCGMAENGKLDSAAVKKIAQPIAPRKKQLSKQNACCVKQKVASCSPVLRENTDCESFSKHVNDSKLIDGIDNEIDLDDDDVNKMAKEFWLDALQEHGGDKNAAITPLKEYTENLRERCKGFDYKLAMIMRGISL